MSANDGGPNPLAGLTLEDILGNEKRVAAEAHQLSSRTLLDIIKDEEPNKRDKKTWSTLKEKLGLKRAGATWTSSVPIPTSDIPIPFQNNNNRSPSQISGRHSISFQTVHRSPSNSGELTQLMTHQDDATMASDEQSTRYQISRRSSSHIGSTSIHSDSFQNADSSENAPPGQNLRPQISQRNSTRFPTDSESNRQERSFNTREVDDGDIDNEPARERTRLLMEALAEERSLSAREAMAAQEAAEAEAEAEAVAGAEEEDWAETAPAAGDSSGAPVRMSLMDLLEETDRQVGLEGSSYIVENQEDEEVRRGVEYNCCVCMVRHKGAAFIPCGHTFCRLCSRELWVSRGNCPLCNGFILEILDIF
ncbi:putative RING/U-box superfamily protein [Quillaja saponaria]|uniref:RING/U-box superfamily protein n=1 Tax=Quillaja saponaria TaxID=32244 RepID=A0AAD7LNQ8_QUISA|nr:putative RING/U-box superfamily protein [Quillaja saponaria]